MTNEKITHTPGPWRVMADPVHAGKHPFHDNRFVTTWNFDEEDGAGSIICSLKDQPDQKGDAELIASAPQLKAENELMRACIGEALIMAENLRKATGDAIPGAICYTLRAALETDYANFGVNNP